MENYKVTTKEAHMIIYGLVCAAVEEKMADQKERYEEFMILAQKFYTWMEEAKHADNA